MILTTITTSAIISIAHSIGNAGTKQHLTSAAGVSNAALNGPSHAELTAHLTRPDHMIILIMIY